MSTDDAYGQPPHTGPQPQAAPPGYGLQPYAGPQHPGQPPAYGPPPGYGVGQTVFPQPYKDTTAAWLFWVFLGGFGAHDFYLRHPGAGVGKICLNLLGLLLTLVLIGYVMLFALFVWWVVDACLMSSRLQQVNNRIYAHNRALGAAH